MVPLVSLWLPILLSAAVVWVVSGLIWNVMPWHRTDYRPIPNEDVARAALRDLAPGQYHVPHCASARAMKDPVFQRKVQEGGNALITVLRKGMPSMSRSLALWFVFNLAVAIVVAYVAGRTLTPGTDYLEVFRVVGTVTWIAYAAALAQEAIWFGRPGVIYLKQLIDGLIYALLSAGFFGWLWPAAV